MTFLLKKPGAWVPIAMSLAMLAFILTYIALYGTTQEPDADEGTPAHLFQLWIVFEFFALVFFSLKWLPQMPREALKIIVLQILVALLPLVVVFFLEH